MRRSVGTSNRGNMRHGLISLLTVIVVLSLATAAVLTVSTSRAMEALAQRQAGMTQEGYDAERAAQTMLAELDDELHAAKAKGTTNAAALTRVVEQSANRMLAKACPQGITATYSVNNTNLQCEFSTPNGRMLQTVVAIGDGGTYDVVSWKLTAVPQSTDTDETLWTGPAAKE